MARGRPPKPTTLAFLAGDPGKRRRYSTEPEAPAAAPEALPEPPEYLDPLAREEWLAIVPVLSTMRVLTDADRTALISYCEAWSRYRRTVVLVEALGPITGDGRYSPLMRVLKDTQALVYRYLIEFGLTPAARARMRTPADSSKPAAGAGKWAKLFPA